MIRTLFDNIYSGPGGDDYLQILRQEEERWQNRVGKDPSSPHWDSDKQYRQSQKCEGTNPLSEEINW